MNEITKLSDLKPDGRAMDDETGGTVLGKLLNELAEFQMAYSVATMEEESARAKRTELLNRVNGAQAAIDKAFAALRKSAPRESDWSRNE